MLQALLTTINILVNKELKAFVMDESTEFSFMGYGKMKEGSINWLKSSVKSSTSYYQIPFSSLSHWFAPDG